MAPISAAVLKKDLIKYLDKTITENEILNVSTQKGNVIILNADRYYEATMSEAERLEELEAIRQADDDIAHGRVYTHEEVFGELRAMANERINATKA